MLNVGSISSLQSGSDSGMSGIVGKVLSVATHRVFYPAEILIFAALRRLRAAASAVCAWNYKLQNVLFVSNVRYM